MTATMTQTPTVDPKVQRLKEYAALTARKRELDAELKDVKARLEEMEPNISEQFQAEGTQSINIDGFTIYLKRQLFAGPVDGNKEAMIGGLLQCDEGWSFLVKDSVNHNQLQARVRECDLDEQGMPVLPAELVNVMQVHEVFRIGARKSIKK